MTDKKKLDISLTEDEALVLFEWLSNFNELEDESKFNHQSEKRVLWDLESSLEEKLSTVLSGDYREKLEAARSVVADD